MTFLILAAALAGTDAVQVTDLPIVRPHVRVSPFVVRVRRAPSVRAPLRGRIGAFQPYHVMERIPTASPGCDEGWGRVADGAWACLDRSTETGATPQHLPAGMLFDPPRPDEAAAYRRSGTWPREPGDRIEVPAVFGRRSGRFSGWVWPTVEAWLADEPPTGRLKAGDSVHFYDAIDTPRGTVLVREDTHVVPLEQVQVYPMSRFAGVDLETTPAPEGAVPAWSDDRRGLALTASPTKDAEVVWTADDRTLLWMLEHDGEHALLRDPAGVHADTWAPLDALHTWRPLPAPDGVDGLWIDIDLGEQVLALRDGEALRYATLVSTGKRGDATPLGLYRVMDKVVAWDMASLPGAADPYYVEAVPWVVHFWPRYALHGAYWHDVFGHTRSHGCVNLALLDADALFDLLEPVLPPGWTTVFEAPEAPGTLIRVRHDSPDVPDRRRAL